MDAYIKKIYDMLYSPIISPYNLLENAKLENYSYVKYFTNEEGLVAEMQCVIPGEGEMVFYYQFDKKDYFLVRVVFLCSGRLHAVSAVVEISFAGYSGCADEHSAAEFALCLCGVFYRLCGSVFL